MKVEYSIESAVKLGTCSEFVDPFTCERRASFPRLLKQTIQKAMCQVTDRHLMIHLQNSSSAKTSHMCQTLELYLKADH